MKYKSGYKYQLAEDEKFKVKIFPGADIKTKFIDLDIHGNLLVKKDYAWDGCSGPTKDTKSNMRAGLGHDALYQFLRMKLLAQKWREQADEELKRIFIEDGMKVAEKSNRLVKSTRKRIVKIRAYYFHKAVRKFGKSSASPSNRRAILKAP